ncbi:hypothetical protein COV20_02560 [Candidatus Woesearchaeota archaeon CG10_big_fil_rev_8_21_14_0_10_45_16]|nr:MAG: hypothetical protein COV20_02560 [Candidatus Woesearchaeota archaeon CG10_big_fil_rev_8_21_14_0_10_45_16]
MDRHKTWLLVGIAVALLGIVILVFFSQGTTSGQAVLQPGELVSCSFEGNSLCEGVVLRGYGEVQPVVGKQGSAIHLSDRGYATGPSSIFGTDPGKPDHYEFPDQGAVEFWYKPDPGAVGDLFTTQPVSNIDTLRIRYVHDRLVVALYSDTEQPYLMTQVSEDIIFKPGRWYHLAFSWRRNAPGIPDELHLFIDGREAVLKTEFGTRDAKLLSDNSLAATIELGHIAKLPKQMYKTFTLGLSGGAAAAGTYDELKIHDRLITSFCPLCGNYQSPVIYQKPLFGEEGKNNLVFPTSKPMTDEIINSVEISAAPGEFEPASFTVYSPRALSSVSVTTTPLVSGQNSIPLRNIDVRVVKVWKQAGYDLESWSGQAGGVPSQIPWDQFGVFDKSGVLVPELLVYNDQETYKDNYDAQGRYISPSISTTLQTEIPAGTSKQFWITVEIPNSTPAGNYQGTLSLTSSGQSIRQIPFTVRVLPFTLDEPEQTRAIFYRAILSPDFSRFPRRSANYLEVLPEQQMRQQMQDIKDHGFNALTLNTGGQPEAELQKTLQMAKEIGFEKVIQSCYYLDADSSSSRCGDLEIQIKLTRRAGFEPIFLGPDEVNNFPNPDSFRVVFDYYLPNIKSQGAKSLFTSNYAVAKFYGDSNSEMYNQVYQGQTDPIRVTNPEFTAMHPDIAAIALPVKSSLNRGFERYNAIMQGAPRDGFAAEEWYYWQLGRQYPKLTRHNTGLVLWLTQARGFIPYVYQHLASPGVYTGPPFEEFSSTYVAEKGYLPPQMATYPSQQGPIPTLEWEAMREGIDDLKYLVTLQNRLDSIRLSDSALYGRVTAELNRQLDPFRNLNAWQALSDADYRNLREFIISKILEIDAANPRKVVLECSPLNFNFCRSQKECLLLAGGKWVPEFASCTAQCPLGFTETAGVCERQLFFGEEEGSPQNLCVDTSVLLQSISQWRNGQLDTADLLTSIQRWRTQENC